MVNRDLDAKRNSSIMEIIRRVANNPNYDLSGFYDTLKWVSGITPISTETAFQLAKGGREVYMIYADGTDSLLEDIAHEEGYYKDKSKTYPDIETIFVVEGVL